MLEKTKKMKKTFAKKKKSIAMFVTTALITASFMVAPDYNSYANQINSGSGLIHNIVLSVNGTSGVINLKDYMQSINNQYSIRITNSTNTEEVADYNHDFLNAGLLEVKGLHTGKATFNVTALGASASEIQESFDVLVTSFGDDFFDVGDLVTFMNQQPNAITTSAETTSFLDSIEPRYVRPITEMNNMLVFQGVKSAKQRLNFGESLTINPTGYFTDTDTNVEISIHYFVTSSNPDIASISYIPNEGTFKVSTAETGASLQNVTITLIANDENGSFAFGSFPLDILPNSAPVISKPITNYYINSNQSSTVNLNLNDYFTDPEGDALTFNVNGNEISGSTLNLTNAATGSFIVSASDGIAGHTTQQVFSVSTFASSPFTILNVPSSTELNGKYVTDASATYSVRLQNTDLGISASIDGGTLILSGSSGSRSMVNLTARSTVTNATYFDIFGAEFP